MREVEIAIRDEKYQERKPIHKKYLLIGYFVVGFLLLFTLLTRNSLLLLLFLTLFSTIINYETNMTSIRFNPQPEVFSALLITQVISFPVALIMLLLPTLIIDIYTARLDIDTFISLVLTLLISFIMSKFMIFGFVFFAILLVTLKFIIALVINLTMNISSQELLFEHVLGFIVNLVLLLAFGNFFFTLFYK